MAQFELTVSGTFHLTVDEQPVRPFRTDKARALLAFLAMESDRPHQRQALAAIFWPEMASADALHNLRKTLYLVRQGLRDATPEAPDALLTITRQAVQLNSVNLSVDMVCFQSQVQARKEHSHRHLHLCHECLLRLQQGLALYRGDFLAGFSLPDSVAFEGWTLAWQEHLYTLARQSLHQLAAAHALRGEFEQARIYAARWVELDPYDEEAVQDLMKILAQSGQRGESLAVYNRAETLLYTEMGLAPDDRTTDLRDAIRADTAWHVAPNGPGQLRLEPRYTPFVGRTGQIVQIQEKLLDPACRLLTLLGPGGIGKSRLATTVAENMAAYGIFPDGIYSVPALGITGPEGLLTALAVALRLTDAQRGMASTGSGLKKVLIDYLASRRCLLVVDDFEPNVPAVHFLVDLLAGAPQLSLLVTARRPLHVRAEHQFRLRGLAYPSLDGYDASPQSVAETARHGAVQLFVQSARQAQPDFALTQANQRTVVRICNLVEGMPLALRIAAGWVRLMSCAAIADQLSCPETALDLLVSPLHDLPERHVSLIALFDHDWQGLTLQEQQTLAWLSSLPESFDLKTVVSGVDTSVETRQILVSLLDKSMLQRGADRRLFLPGLLQQYLLRQAMHLDPTELPDRLTAERLLA